MDLTKNLRSVASETTKTIDCIEKKEMAVGLHMVVIVSDWINAPCEDPTVTAEAVRFISVQRNAVLMSSGRSECGLWKMFSDSMNMFGF